MKAHNLKSTDLLFRTEKEFAKWFKDSYFLFGIKEIIKIDPFFPDVLAIMMDGSKKYIELEYHASNFRQHKHYAPFCDLIISYLKCYDQDFVSGVPVLSLFECKKYDSIKEIKPSKFLLSIYELMPFRHKELPTEKFNVREIEVVREIIREVEVIKDVEPLKKLLKEIYELLKEVKDEKLVNAYKSIIPKGYKLNIPIK